MEGENRRKSTSTVLVPLAATPQAMGVRQVFPTVALADRTSKIAPLAAYIAIRRLATCILCSAVINAQPGGRMPLPSQAKATAPSGIRLLLFTEYEMFCCFEAMLKLCLFPLLEYTTIR
jgi:hypothetical protein